MSTYIYLQCKSHNPPLRAEQESGQHLYDLPQLRADVAGRVLSEEDSTTEYFRRHTMDFLADHRQCSLGIVDEYDREYAINHISTEKPPDYIRLGELHCVHTTMPCDGDHDTCCHGGHGKRKRNVANFVRCLWAEVEG